MILDEVLNESSGVYDNFDAKIIFVEGFAYALKMQEEGQKASSIEELSETLSEVADSALNELSVEAAAALGLVAVTGGLYALNHVMEKKMKKEAKEIIENLLKDKKYAKIKKDLTTNFEHADDYKEEYIEDGYCKIMIPLVVYSLKSENSSLSTNKKIIKDIISEANKTFHGRFFKLHASSYSKSGETWLLITIIANKDAKYDPNRI